MWSGTGRDQRGALNAAIQTASIASMAAAGILTDVVGIRTAFAIGGAITLAAAVVVWALFRRAGTAEELEPATRPAIPDADETLAAA